MSNLKLWQSVEKTDPSATKTSNHGGRTQTSIDGYYMFMRATEAFGPMGIGWGFNIKEERWDEGALIPIKSEDNTVRFEQSKTHTVVIDFWYILDGARGEFPAIGHTPAVYKSKYGASDDGEAPKKSLTDAVKKALSFLGFGGDIFMGKFEDTEYLQMLKVEAEIGKAEDKAAEVDSKRADIIDYITRQISAIETARAANEVNAFAKSSIRHLDMQKKIPQIKELCETGILKITKLANDKKQSFTGDQK